MRQPMKNPDGSLSFTCIAPTRSNAKALPPRGKDQDASGIADDAAIRAYLDTLSPEELRELLSECDESGHGTDGTP